MKYVTPREGNYARVELSRRNLEALLAKLDDPSSARTLMKQENEEDGNEWIEVVAVEDEAHYKDRPAGTVYMPTSGEVY